MQKKLDLVNYEVSEKELGCDGIDQHDNGDRVDTADRVTGFTV